MSKTKNLCVALYLRSSKDRSAVSIDAQRRELQTMARERGWTAIAEYVDVVESGKTEFRSGIQAVMRAMREPEQKRGWCKLLMTDTSRLSRRRFFAQIFRREAEKAGVEVVFATMPETDPITGIILSSVFEAMDEVHSLMSREKGLAGMAENVRQGFRAGGRAPRGYRLKEVQTGQSREGCPITKTVLEPNADAPKVARYLKARARGIARGSALAEAGAKWAITGMIGAEWNSYCYAGHTVWNRHSGDGVKKRYRPQEEWVIQRDTHEALIDDTEAEAILYQLRHSKIGAAVSLAKSGMSKYLLVGLAFAPDGRPWVGYVGRYYRLRPTDDGLSKGKYVSLAELDEAVKRQVLADLKSPDLARDLAKSAKLERESDKQESDELRLEIARLDAQISKTMDMAASLDDPSIVLGKINELSARKRDLQEEIDRSERDRIREDVIDTMDEKKVLALLRDLSGDLDRLSYERWRELLFALVARVTLDPATLQCRIHYRLKKNNLCSASPRGHTGYVERSVTL